MWFRFMIARLIGPTPLSSVCQLCPEYVKSLLEIAQSLTGLTQLAKNAVVGKLKLFLGSVGPVVNAVDFLVALGFTEPMTNFL